MPKVTQLPNIPQLGSQSAILVVDEQLTKRITYSDFVDQISGEFQGFGAQGAQGIQGAQGFQGNEGEVGPPGPQGWQGPADGYQGEKGFQGDQGAQGFQGYQGYQGYQGQASTVPGPQGAQGVPGAQGPAGGPQGAQGHQGVQGATGGPQGFQGYQGYQGELGVRGFQGFDGPQGLPGAQGAQGDLGVQGAQGVPGAQGAQGEVGVGVPVGGNQGQILIKLSNTNYDTGWDDSGLAVGLSTRQVFSTSTGVIANNSTANVSVEGFSTYILSKVVTTAPAWVRIYTDTTARSNDSSRTEDTDPLPGSGVIVEVITTASSLTQSITPAVIGFNSTSTDNSVYMAVTNKSGSSQNISVSITILQMED